MKLKGTIIGFDVGIGDNQVEVGLAVTGKTYSNRDEEVHAYIKLNCSRAAVKGYALGDIFEVDINQIKP